MKKTLKKALAFFAFLCMVLLIAVLVQLFVLNRDTEPKDSAPPVSGEPSGTASGEPSGEPAPPNTTGSVQSEPPTQSPTGKRYELPMPNDRQLIFYADEDSFEHMELDDVSDLLTYKDGPAMLEICLVEIPDSARTLAAGFLDNYIDYTGGEVETEAASFIGGSGITGAYVSAKKDGETYEAWIVDLEEGVGFAVVVNYWDGEQKTAIYEVLDTMEMPEA